jgi:hypothetical protein
MDVIRKAIRWVAITGISLILLITMLVNVSPVEFKDPSVFYKFEEVRFIGLPVLTLMLLVSMIHGHDAIVVIVYKVVGSILISAGVLYVMVLALFAGMCQWKDRETVFTHKHDEHKRVIVRDLGCGAWDSSTPVFKTVVVNDLGPWLRTVVAIDTTAMDVNSWIRCDKIR